MLIIEDILEAMNPVARAQEEVDMKQLITAAEEATEEMAAAEDIQVHAMPQEVQPMETLPTPRTSALVEEEVKQARREVQEEE